MKKILGTMGALCIMTTAIQAQTKPAKIPTKQVATSSAKKVVDTVSKKVVTVAKKEEKKMPVHKHAHQAKVVKS